MSHSPGCEATEGQDGAAGDERAGCSADRSLWNVTAARMTMRAARVLDLSERQMRLLPERMRLAARQRSGTRAVVDAVFSPVFRYFDVFDEIVDLGLFAELDKLVACRKALAEQPSVIGAVVSDCPVRLHAFLRNARRPFTAPRNLISAHCLRIFGPDRYA